MSVIELLTEHHLDFVSLKGGCTGSSKSTLVKMPHCWKSLVAHIYVNNPGTLHAYTAECRESEEECRRKYIQHDKGK